MDRSCSWCLGAPTVTKHIIVGDPDGVHASFDLPEGAIGAMVYGRNAGGKFYPGIEPKPLDDAVERPEALFGRLNSHFLGGLSILSAMVEAEADDRAYLEYGWGWL
jgi:hypothetical protein